MIKAAFGSLKFITQGSRGRQQGSHERYENEAIFRVHRCSHSPARQGWQKPEMPAFTSQSEISHISTRKLPVLILRPKRAALLFPLQRVLKGTEFISNRLRRRPFPFVRPSPDYLFLLRAFESRGYTGKLHQLLQCQLT